MSDEVSPAATPAPDPAAPVAAADPPAPTPPKDEVAEDPWCRTPVHRFEPTPGTRVDAPPLTEVLPGASLVAVVVPELRQSDCSGIGHAHLSYVPADGDESGLDRAYRSVGLDAQLPNKATHYLLGGELIEPRSVDLQHVCIPFEETVNARVRWVLPLDDPQGAAARLRAGACGRVPVPDRSQTSG